MSNLLPNGGKRFWDEQRRTIPKNLKGLEAFKKLSLEQRLKFLQQLGIIEKSGDKYKLSKEYGGE